MVSVDQEFRCGSAGQFCSVSLVRLPSSEGLTVAGGPTSKKAHVLLQEASAGPHVGLPTGCSSGLTWQPLPPEQVVQERMSKEEAAVPLMT